MLIRSAVCIASVALIASCSSGKPQRVVTVTVPPSHHSSTAATNSPSAAAGTSSTSPNPTGTAAVLTKLDGTCDTLLPDYSISQAVGGDQLAGTEAFVVGKPDPAIARLGYLNCRYGVTGAGAAATAKIEIGISLYATPAKAAARLSATVDDYTAHGATGAPATVDGRRATMLTGGAGPDYDVPLLVVAAGQRTVAVNVAPGVATGAKATADATALATLALHRTGG